MATPSPAGMPVLSPRAKRVLIAIVALIVVVVLWYQFVGIYVDYAWFREIKQTGVFTTQLGTRVVLFFIAGVGIGLVIWLSLLMAYRSRPVFLPSNEIDPLAPYRVIVTARPKLFAIGIAVVVGLICGASAQGSWQTVQLWMHGGNFGITDPEFGHDVGFYMFRLPMIQMIISWLFTATVLAFISVLVTQYVFGGIRLSAGKHRKVTSQAALQLSLLVGVFVLIKAVQYWFDRYDLLFSNRSGIFTGASYTDVHAVLAAKIILMCIAAICAIGFIVGGILKSIKLPVIALILLVLSSAVVGGIWPLILQKVVVEPSAITREVPYIERNIAATRQAYGIGTDKVQFVNYTADKKGVNPAQLAAEEPGTVNNARLLDPNLLSDTFTQREQLRNFYGFAGQLSVDRYQTNGKEQDYIVAAREIDVANFQEGQQGWINQHLVYTHGDGFVAAPANQLVDGYPVFEVSDVANPKGGIPVSQPRIYFGALAPDYAIVGAPDGASPREYDTDTTQYTYQGTGGVPVGSFINRLIFATQYGEANFLFSSEINSDSKILYNRDPRVRVEKAAPFLTVDTRPYPAVVDGRIVWIVDAYTTAQNFPYAQTVTLSEATTNSQQTGANATLQTNTQVSYIRNSVKAVVDAYDGTVSLYQVQDNDPVLKAWEGVFPGLIKPESAITPDLRAHFRYPEDLFEVQRGLIGKYYVSNPTEFYQGSNFWKVPNDPTESNVTAAQPPYYLEIAMPGTTKPQFMLTTAMTWFQREYISAYITANGDPDNYGKITVQQLPVDTQTPGPVLIQQLFNSNTNIANYITTRTTASRSQILTGNLLTLPTDKGLLFVEPLYLQGVSANSYPQLGQVLVWYNGQVGMGPSLAAALDNASPADLSAVNGASGGTSSTTSSSSPPSTKSGVVSTPPSVSGSTGPTSTSGGPLPDAAQALAAMRQAEQELSTAKQSGDLAAIGSATEKLYAAVQTYLEVAGPTATTAAGSTTGGSGTTSSGG
ncbi:MAG: membrane protein [Actinobacteria bacterium 69-20]|nr:MAG: membrane protein [Actinobacteria bacterium 69-20]